MEESNAFLAELEVLTGKPEEAVRRLEPLAAAEEVHHRVRPMLAWALLEAGTVERAEEAVSAALSQAHQAGGRFHMLEALRVQGMIRLRQGRLDEAERALMEGLELARSLPNPYGEGRITVQLGLLARQRDEPVQAAERFGQALHIFRRLGAGKDIERTEELRAQLAAV